MKPEAEIIAMVAIKDVLYVARTDGVYRKDGDGVFHRMQIGEREMPESAIFDRELFAEACRSPFKMDDSEKPTHGTPPNLLKISEPIKLWAGIKTGDAIRCQHCNEISLVSVE